jgi:hypothetical protein
MIIYWPQRALPLFLNSLRPPKKLMVPNPPSPSQVRAANRGRAHQPAAPTPLVEVATPAYTEPTVSTLTTAAPTNDSKSEEEEDEELPPIKSVFDCKHLQLRTVNDGKHGWECGWCGKIFSPRHASRALQHVLKIKKGNIAPCTRPPFLIGIARDIWHC